MISRQTPATAWPAMALNRRAVLGGLLGAAVTPAVARAEGAEVWPQRFAHAFGETVLDRPATRVVSLGYTSHDALLALGVVPLALRYWYGDAPFGVWPWAADLLGGAEPVVLTGESGIETVAALQPDLIIGIGSGISQAEYDVLSQVAPVLMHQAGSPIYGMGWDALTRILGQATGKTALAETLIAQTAQAFADARARHPDWQGKTGTAAYHFSGEVGAYAAFDGRSRFLTELGFRLAPAIEAYQGEAFYVPQSPEDLSALEADVLLWLSGTDADDDLAALPMRRLLVSHAQGREVFAGTLTAAAVSYGSILSLPFALQRLEDEIALAADGDAATVVPSSAKAGLAP